MEGHGHRSMSSMSNLKVKVTKIKVTIREMRKEVNVTKMNYEGQSGYRKVSNRATLPIEPPLAIFPGDRGHSKL